MNYPEVGIFSCGGLEKSKCIFRTINAGRANRTLVAEGGIAVSASDQGISPLLFVGAIVRNLENTPLVVIEAAQFTF